MLKITSTYTGTMTETTTAPALTDDAIKQILNLNVEWPICSYSHESRRNNRRRLLPKAVKRSDEQIFNQLNGWHKYPSIAIDGMNGVGKSSLISSLRRKYVKVNLIAPEVTSGSAYNIEPMKSLQYLMASININAVDCAWDRCCYANLMFYFVHYLMAKFKNQRMPSDINQIYAILNTMAIDVNLPSIVTFIKNIIKTPILFLVCSDISMISMALKHRKTPNDVYNSKEYNYQMAQYHVYCYFAQILDCVLIDINELFELGYTLGDIQEIIAEKVDIPVAAAASTKTQVVGPKNVEGFEASRRLNDIMHRLNSQRLLFFDFSNK